MEKEKEIDKINEQIREKEAKERQLRHRLAREESKLAYQKRRSSPEYKARTRRLIEKGGIVEHFYPGTKAMTSEQFYELMDGLEQNPDFCAAFVRGIEKILASGKEGDG